MDTIVKSNQVFKVFDTAQRFTSCFLEKLYDVFDDIGHKNFSINQSYIDEINQSFFECLVNLNEESLEYCDNFSSKFPRKKIGFYIRNILDNAGFSSEQVGPIYNVNRKHKSSQVYQLDVNRVPGKINPIWVPLIVKETSPRSILQSTIINYEPTLPYPIGINFNDPIHEVLVTTLFNSDYDSNNLPNINKFYGYFICPSKNYSDYKHHIITARSSTNLYELITDPTSPNFFKNWLPSNDYTSIFKQNLFLNIIAQFLWTMTYLKTHYNLSHFDCHPKNIMFNYVHDKCFNIPDLEKIDMVYQGKNMKDVDWIVMKLPNDKTIWMDNNGLILKLIDFGQSSITIGKAEIVNPEISKLHTGSEAYEIVSEYPGAKNSQEIIFFIINIIKCMIENSLTPEDKSNQKMMDVLSYMLDGLTDYINDEPILDNIIEGTVSLNEKYTNPSTGETFLYNSEKGVILNPNVPNYTNKTLAYYNPYQIPTEIDELPGIYRKVFWFMNRRDVVDIHQEDKNYWINKFCTLLEKLGLKIDDENYYIDMGNHPPQFEDKNIHERCIVLNMYPQNVPSDALGKFKNSLENYHNICVLNKKPGKEFADKSCRDIRKMVEKHNPNTLLKRKIIGEEYIPTRNVFPKLNLKNFLKKSPDASIADDAINYYFLSINPSNVSLKNINSDTGFLLEKYQRTPSYQEPSEIDSYIDTVRMHIIHVKEIQQLYYDINIKKDLWNSIEKNRNGLVINGGYFIVSNNVNDPLQINTKGERLTSEDLYTPIGYFYTEIDGGNTYLEVPEAYKRYFSAIVMYDDGIEIIPYREFIEQHETIVSQQLYQLEPFDEINVPEQTKNYISEIIRLNPGKVFVNHTSIIATKSTHGIQEPILKEGFKKYKSVFVTGPQLIKNHKIIFDKDELLEETFENSRGEFRVAEQAETPSKFFAEVGEKYFPWGQRHGNFLMNRNLMGKLDDNSLLFIIFEGRGYDAPGIDLVQATGIMEKFGVKTCVSLDGGFSAQAILSYNGVKKYVCNDPEKRKLGISMYFYEE